VVDLERRAAERTIPHRNRPQPPERTLGRVAAGRANDGGRAGLIGHLCHPSSFSGGIGEEREIARTNDAFHTVFSLDFSGAVGKGLCGPVLRAQ
jgi:hypothetical protein